MISSVFKLLFMILMLVIVLKSSVHSFPWLSSGRSVSGGLLQIGSMTGQEYQQDTVSSSNLAIILHPSSLQYHHSHNPPLHMQGMQGVGYNFILNYQHHPTGTLQTAFLINVRWSLLGMVQGMHLGIKDLLHLVGTGSTGLTKGYLSLLLMISIDERCFYHQRWFLILFSCFICNLRINFFLWPRNGVITQMYPHVWFCFWKYSSSCEENKFLREWSVKWMYPIEYPSIF